MGEPGRGDQPAVGTAHRAGSASQPRDQADDPDVGWDYYLEYVRPTGWYRGLAEPTVFVRRIGPGKDVGPTPAILGSIAVPRDLTGSASFLEPSLNVLFEVARFDPDGHIVRVTATRV